jgi:hypothetical protein
MIGIFFSAAYTWLLGFLNRSGDTIITRASDTLQRR